MVPGESGRWARGHAMPFSRVMRAAFGRSLLFPNVSSLVSVLGRGCTLFSHGALVDVVLMEGCADRSIRIFDYQGKPVKQIKGSLDVVRALCSVPSSHPSGAHFASAGNDAVIRLWNLDGKQVAELHGHESFIYALAATRNAELVSSSEDRTVRVWRGTECVQTITHPAISVWSIAVCAETGDIASGASDSIVRVFTKDKSRKAPARVLQAFHGAVRTSAVPKQTLQDVNKEDLPGPEFLERKSGTKDGQVQMIREPNGDISAYQWSSGQQTWTSVGTVVDSAGSTGKKVSHHGKDYDYVFDVDIEDGKPPLKLPYNVSQNPYETATKFIQDNELPLTYLDQVANFITTNAQGASIGQQSSESDVWGTGSRYRPDAGTTDETATPPSILPQKEYLSIKSANLPVVLRKIQEFNQTLLNEGDAAAAIESKDMEVLLASKDILETRSQSQVDRILQPCIPLFSRMLVRWPAGYRLPVIDLARLYAAATAAMCTRDFFKILSAAAFEDADRSNNIMMAVRTFGNFFSFADGRHVMDSVFDTLTNLISPYRDSGDRNMSIAIATLLVNYATLYVSVPYKSLPSTVERATMLLRDSCELLGADSDSEAVYRALVGAGTLLDLGEEVHLIALGSYNLLAVASKAQQRFPEVRIATVVKEIRQILQEYK